MQRRDFLAHAAFVAAGLPILDNPMGRRVQFPATSPGREEPLSRDLEALIPRLMNDARVAGLSIAVVRGGVVSW